jgi:acyl transferase domain-containing protein/phosphopantetheinyl transferase (holo-ACP synthase)
VAAVNAFGFGGINAHVVLEEHAHTPRRASPVMSVAALTRDARVPATGGFVLPTLAQFAAATPPALGAALRAGQSSSSGGPARLLVADPTPERLARAAAIVEKGRPWRGREDIWFAPEGLVASGGRVAFAFPGIDAAFAPRVDDVARHFGLPVPTHLDAKDLEETGLGVVGVSRLLLRVLGDLGVRFDVAFGHSIGEWTAMIATGVIPEPALEAFLSQIAPGTLDVPGVAFAAAGCGVAEASTAMAGLPDIALSHDNCPHQVLFCGKDTSVDVALDRLREAGVLCQKLPFRSGFHSPLFADYVAPHERNFARLPLRGADRPLWSATTCAPYPADPDAIRALSLRHLVEPVRFRELVSALHRDGVRVFVQVGTGSLVNFIEDTLRGAPHVALTANAKERPGMAQLFRVLAQLFVEGVDVAFDKLARADAPRGAKLALGVPMVRFAKPLALPQHPAKPAAAPAPAPLSLTGHPLAGPFAAVLDDIARAQHDVAEALRTAPPTRPVLAPARAASRRVLLPLGPREAATRLHLSLDAFPELIDHTFFRQPPGWPNLADRHPVVPMTTSLDLMKRAAEALVPERVVVAMEDVRAYRWLVVSTPVDATVIATFDGESRVHVRIVAAGGRADDTYAEGIAVLADAYPPPPPPDTADLPDARPAPVTAHQLYDERWMFHGPAYQGVVDVGTVGADSIRGVLRVGAACGMLLDNAGQLFGYRVMIAHDKDRMAMPVRLGRVRFFGPDPAVGDRIACTVHIRRTGPKDVVADLSLDRLGAGAPSANAAWVRIEEWEDRRFETDPRLWEVMLRPESNLLGAPQSGGWVRFDDVYRGAPTRDQLARRFLSERERGEYDAQGPRKQRGFLAGRIAAKDAVRDLLFRLGHGPMFPVEVAIHSDAAGRPLVSAPPGAGGACVGGHDVRVSIAHKDEIAVAIAAVGRDVGIDVERIEERPRAFADLAFSATERAMRSRCGDGAEGESEWLTRLWVAKEAAAKARGTGLKGDPQRFPVTDRTRSALLVAGVWVETVRSGDYVIGWTTT